MKSIAEERRGLLGETLDDYCKRREREVLMQLKQKEKKEAESMVQTNTYEESKESKFVKKIIALAEENGLTVYEFKQSIEIAILAVENSKVSSDNGENERWQVAESAVSARSSDSAKLSTFIGESSEAVGVSGIPARKEFRPLFY